MLSRMKKLTRRRFLLAALLLIPGAILLTGRSPSAARQATGESPSPDRAPASLFDYDTRVPFDVRGTSVASETGAVVRDVTYAGAAGARLAAYLVEPAAAPRRAGVLFVHWYEPESPDSNRTQFLREAVELAGRGVVSLLVETMWSEPEWFMTRDNAKDFDSSVRQVRELRRALELLLAQPGVAAGRVAYVGHDFGAMYGSIVAAIDRRVAAWVLMAGTTSFSDWFLLHPKLEGKAREAVVEKLAVLDPVKFIGSAAPAAVLFQFGMTDPYVPLPSAERFFAATSEPKEVRWYAAGHHLNADAARERRDWLVAKLGL